MKTGIYAFAERFATAMTSEEARAATDKDQFQQEYWDKCLSWIEDEQLRHILSEAGPFMLGKDLKGLIDRIFTEFDASDRISEILIGLLLLRDGTNPNVIRDRFLPWWDTDHFIWLMNRAGKQGRRTPKEEYVKPDDV